MRAKEYLPYADETLSPPEPDPKGALYPRFLLDEVVPYVERHYRVLRGVAHRVLGGSSYGAGVALYTLTKRPHSFDGLLLESPSVYAGDYRLLREAASVRKWPRRIYIGTGTVGDPVDDVKRLQALFEEAGLGPDRLLVKIQAGAAHTERWWAERLPDALQFLFPGSPKDPKNAEKPRATGAKAYFRSHRSSASSRSLGCCRRAT